MRRNREDWIFEKMERQKQGTVKYLSKTFGVLAEDIAQVIISAHLFECPHGNKLFDLFDLSQKDIYAFGNDAEGFENELFEEDIQRQIMAMEE